MTISDPTKAGDRQRTRAIFYQFFPSGGIGRYTHELASALARREAVEPTVVCPPAYPWKSAAPYRTLPILYDIGHKTPVIRKTRFLLGQFISPARLRKAAAQTRADVIHFSNVNHLTYPLWRATNPSSPAACVTVHDVRRAVAIVNRAYEERQLRRFYRDCDALFVHSAAQRDELTDWAGVAEENVVVVPHGPYEFGPAPADARQMRKRLGVAENMQMALFFGNVRDDKNLDLLLRAVVPYRNSVHLVIAGRAGGSHRPMGAYRRLIDELDLGASTTVVDSYVSDDLVPAFMAAADWVALPYSNSFTSQSGVLNIAAAYDRPLLATAAPTFSEILERFDLGVLVAPDDVDALAAGVGRIVHRVAEGSPFAFEAYRKRYRWDENARITESVYQAITVPGRPVSPAEAAGSPA